MHRLVAGVFDCAVSDIEPDDMLDDAGLDSMMAMDFRVRINTMFSIDLPVLEILRGVSVNSLSERIVAELHVIHGPVPTADAPTAAPQSEVTDDDVAKLIDGMSATELQALLAELESENSEQRQGGPQR